MREMERKKSVIQSGGELDRGRERKKYRYKTRQGRERGNIQSERARQKMAIERERESMK